MSINDDIYRRAERLMDQGRRIGEVKMSTKTRGHLAEEWRKRQSFQNAYKVPATITDHVKDLQVSVTTDENHLESSWVQGQVRKQQEREKIVERLVPTRMQFRGEWVPIVIDETLPDDQVAFTVGEVKEMVDYRTGRMIRVVNPER